jgi:hypothetical protein
MSEMYRTPSPFEPHDRQSVLSLSPLSPIGDIASATLTEQAGSETVTWSTASDWDNAVSESYVDHDTTSDIVNMVRGLDSFEDFSPGDTPGSPYTNVASNVDITNTQAFDGSNSLKFEGIQNVGITLDLTSNPQTPDEFVWYHYETGSETDHSLTVLNGNGDPIVRSGSNNPQQIYVTGTQGEQIAKPSTRVWHKWRFFNFDYTNGTFDVEWAEPSSNTSVTRTGQDGLNSFSNIGGWEVDRNGYWQGGSASSEDSWVDLVWGVYATSTLTTSTKAFSSAGKPNLQNLSYTLNGQNITLEIIGSPGTASEEVVTQSLDGSTSYSLSWSNTHTDFRVKMKLESTDRTTTASVSKVELVIT